MPMVLKLGLWAGVFGLALRFAGCPVWLRILWTARLKASRLFGKRRGAKNASASPIRVSGHYAGSHTYASFLKARSAFVCDLPSEGVSVECPSTSAFHVFLAGLRKLPLWSPPLQILQIVYNNLVRAVVR